MSLNLFAISVINTTEGHVWGMPHWRRGLDLAARDFDFADVVRIGTDLLPCIPE